MFAGRTADLLNQLLVNTFAELGMAGPMIRTLLLRDREFVGQRFRCEGLQAVVLAGAKEIKLCEEKGALLKSVSLEDTEKKEATCDRSKEQ